jgi:2-(1,2-epoxy-1,2-dihydrophenyl)acetyl-CoA isomerase
VTDVADRITAAAGPVLLRRQGAVAVVTLNRPDRLNAMTRAMLLDLLAVLESLAADDSVRAVVLTGAGRAFCAGADLAAEPVWGEGTPAQRGAELRRLMESTQLLHDMPKPTLAAINGPCAGAGLALACAADIRIASANAVFRTAFLGAGLGGDFGITWSLPRLLGVSKAREMLLLDERVDAEQAHHIGLVGRLYPADELPRQAIALAERLARQAPLATTAIKANCNDAERLHLAAALDAEARRMVTCADSDDAREAATAFVEKRTPQFHGR